METIQRPYLKSLDTRGYIQGCTISTRSSNTPLCHYFGGLRYALPPTKRWRKAQKLPLTYSYGTKDRPYQCPGATQSCPQATFFNLSSTAAGNEDCFQCNVWVPHGDPPENGMYLNVDFPQSRDSDANFLTQDGLCSSSSVRNPGIYLISQRRGLTPVVDGGFLQFGSPNSFSAAALLGETDFNAIVVMPAYRLNVLGFLYSSELEQDAASVGETVGNHGFWDQRMALEWTNENIGFFGGNGSQITLAGYSAGTWLFLSPLQI